MKSLTFAVILATTLFSSSSFAGQIYKFKNKSVLLKDSKTALSIKDGQAIVYYQYQYSCLTDGIRPTTCVQSKFRNVDIIDGRVEVEAFELEKTHLTGRNPSIEIQISEKCETHPYYSICEASVPLAKWNDQSHKEVLFPLK